MIKLLLVEDDLDLAGNITDFLELEEMVCDYASNGVAALSLMADNHYQVVILDINLPRLDGLSVCECLRQRGDDTPVIMLTARDQLEDKLQGFARGTDDYLVKPFAMAELIARIRALAVRKSGQARQLVAGNVSFNVNTRQVQVNGEAVKLSPTGITLLNSLMRAGMEPVERNTLIEAVWGDNCPDSNSLKVHLHHLRKALTAAGANVEVNAVPGVGFQLVVQQEK